MLVYVWAYEQEHSLPPENERAHIREQLAEIYKPAETGPEKIEGADAVLAQYPPDKWKHLVRLAQSKYNVGVDTTVQTRLLSEKPHHNAPNSTRQRANARQTDSHGADA